eukprot:352517-Chlamydomonas_euryale.AAC.3
MQKWPCMHWMSMHVRMRWMSMHAYMHVLDGDACVHPCTHGASRGIKLQHGAWRRVFGVGCLAKGAWRRVLGVGCLA